MATVLTRPTSSFANTSRAAAPLAACLTLAGCVATPRPQLEAHVPAGREEISDPRCVASDFTRSDGLFVWSPDGSRYIVNKKDAKGVYQLYIRQTEGGGETCITCTARPNSPAADKHKLQPRWFPDGQWIVMAGEWQKDHKPFWAPNSLVEGWVASGLSVDIYVARADGSEWHRLSDFENGRGDGFTGVAISPDGRRAVWAQIVDGNVFRYPFGKWELVLADVRRDANGAPSFVNPRDITPNNNYWYETGNFAPDNRSLIITGNYRLKNAEGMDQFVLDVENGNIRNITNEPVYWDEHGRFSPDGRKVLYMSSAPFKSAERSKMLSLATEFMIMNSDGSGRQQLTHFNYKGYPESNTGGRISVAANGEWRPDGRAVSVQNLFFPNYETWTITFNGNCGAEAR